MKLALGREKIADVRLFDRKTTGKRNRSDLKIHDSMFRRAFHAEMAIIREGRPFYRDLLGIYTDRLDFP